MKVLRYVQNTMHLHTQVACQLVKRSNILHKLSPTELETYEMFTTKVMSVDEIAKRRAMKPVDILSHLSSAMEAGHFVDYRRGTTYVCMYVCMYVCLLLSTLEPPTK